MFSRGSYSVMITEKLKLVSLNTGYCETTNFFLYINQTDPDDSLAWLVNEVHTSEQLGQMVHIVAHIPPGDSECLEGWARNYYRIVNRCRVAEQPVTELTFAGSRKPFELSSSDMCIRTVSPSSTRT